MWSDKYYYYNIQSENKSVDKSIVIKTLLDTGCFLQKDHQRFTNVSDFPWVDIMLVESTDGNFSSSGKEDLSVNTIAIVCSKSQDIDQQIYIDVFLQIAEKLNWRLYLEQDDDENENIVLKRK